MSKLLDKTKPSFKNALDFPFQNSSQTILSLEEPDIFLHVLVGLRNSEGYSCLIHEFPVFFIGFLRLGCLKVRLIIVDGFFSVTFLFEEFAKVVGRVGYCVLCLSLFGHPMVFVKISFSLINVFEL